MVLNAMNFAIVRMNSTLYVKMDSRELLGISTSLFEMEKLKFLWEALRHKKLIKSQEVSSGLSFQKWWSIWKKNSHQLLL